MRIQNLVNKLEYLDFVTYIHVRGEIASRQA